MYQHNHLYIDGAWCAADQEHFLEVINPATEQPFARVIQGNARDVDKAVQAARVAFPEWSTTPASERANYIDRIAEQLHHRRQEFAQLISSELGMPLHLSLEVQVNGPIEGLRSYAALARHMEEEERVDNAQVLREPIGVCAFINPWNYPLHQLIGKLAPALAAGCCMVVKPSEETPLHAFLLAEIIDQVGLPAGVFNLVSGPGKVVGEAMATHPEVDMVSFTGSTGAGIRVAEVAAKSVKRVCQELGGKSALLITEDADLEAAVTYGVQDVMINSGQTCTALSRMLVPRSRYFEASVMARKVAESLQVGDPSNPASDLGPMCSQRQYETVLRYIVRGIDEGARMITGGLPSENEFKKGYYIRPTIFVDVDNRMDIAQDEIFGPVLCIIAYDTLEEAVSIANDSPFGLSGGVWAEDKDAAARIARRLRTGQVFLNGADFSYQAPFGGYKQSGNGREWGLSGLDEFIERKALLY
jgi:aldehyde dehydrogenase (NAD+)